jgi:hypothetical protein
MRVSRFRTILYTIVAIVAVAGLADATYLTVQALTGETLTCGGSPDCFRWNSGGYPWSARLFHCVHFRHIRSVRLPTGAKIPCFDRWCHVSGDTLAAVRSSFSAARVLPILFVLSGNHISYCRSADRRTAITTPVGRMSRMLV